MKGVHQAGNCGTTFVIERVLEVDIAGYKHDQHGGDIEEDDQGDRGVGTWFEHRPMRKGMDRYGRGTQHDEHIHGCGVAP
jgi:hypothetical protein